MLKTKGMLLHLLIHEQLCSILSLTQVEQLCNHTGEESIILTASVNDGSLSHLGSELGKGFLEGREEIKSQFLGFCLKGNVWLVEKDRY